MLLFLTIISFSIIVCSATPQEYGLCYQVYLMKQYCNDIDVTPTENVTVIQKHDDEGPRGPPGERGLPGFVNYSRVDDILMTKIGEFERRMDTKRAHYKDALTQSLTELEKEIETESMEYKSIEKELEKSMPSGCHEVKPENATSKSGKGGVFDVYTGNTKIKVFCDLTTDGGGWTVFQRRFDGSQNFNNKWKTYVKGFGNITGEYWLGLENIHLLTQDGVYELQIELTNENDTVGIANYQKFSIDGRNDNYKFRYRGRFKGKHLTNQLAYHNNMPFSTKNRDNESWYKNCAKLLKGGWWFNECHYSNLNGVYGDDEKDKLFSGYLGIYWAYFDDIKATEMKFRRTA